jgi:hypothetical protein
MVNMSESSTETQAALYRDRALHYLKAAGGGAGIKESKVVVSVAETGSSLLSDALKAPELRKLTENDGRARQVGSVLEDVNLGGARGGRRGRTPDVRVTKKKLTKYERSGRSERKEETELSTAAQQRPPSPLPPSHLTPLSTYPRYLTKAGGNDRRQRGEVRETDDDLGLGGQLVEGADEDFVTLLKQEAANEKNHRHSFSPSSRGSSPSRGGSSRGSRRRRIESKPYVCARPPAERTRERALPGAHDNEASTPPPTPHPAPLTIL